jgi:hypothetical protein
MVIFYQQVVDVLFTQPLLVARQQYLAALVYLAALLVQWHRTLAPNHPANAMPPALVGVITPDLWHTLLRLLWSYPQAEARMLALKRVGGWMFEIWDWATMCDGEALTSPDS